MRVAHVTAIDRNGQMLGSQDVTIEDYQAWVDNWENRLSKIECRCSYCGQLVYPHFPKGDIKPYYAASSQSSHLKGCRYYCETLTEKAAYLDTRGDRIKLEELMLKLRVGSSEGDDKKSAAGKKNIAVSNGKDMQEVESKTEKRIMVTAKGVKTLIDLLAVCKSDESPTYAGIPKKNILVDSTTIHYHRKHWGADGLIKLVVCQRTEPPKVVDKRMEADGIKSVCLVFEAKYPCIEGEKKIFCVLKLPDEYSRNKILKGLAKQADKAEESNHVDRYLLLGAWSKYDERRWFDAYICNLTNPGCFHKLPKKYDYE